MSIDVTIRDVTPRDGLQPERPVPAVARAELSTALADAGLQHVEVASFVSATAVPAMAAASDVVAALPSRQGVSWWALVPNQRGAELAVMAGVRSLTVTVSASEEYSQRNVRRSTAESIARVRDIVAVARSCTTDVVISCSFGSPYDDVTVRSNAAVVDAVRSAGVSQITLADTTGAATPRRIADVLDAVGVDVGLHLHDTRRTALVNALAALDRGVRRFDTAVGGLGGSPFATGAGGNLATEDLVLVLEDLGVVTGIDLGSIDDIVRGLPDLVGHGLPQGRDGASELPPFPRH